MFRVPIGLNVHKVLNNVEKSRIGIELKAYSSKCSSNVCTDDCVSPSHSVSNLRLIRFAKVDIESETEKQFRIERIKLQKWNHNYWLKNNKDFQKQKSEYIEKELNGSQEFKSTLSYDELSLFYKKFLDTNHKKHMNYNLEWYRRHTSLLWPAFVVFLIRLKRRLLLNK